MSNHTESKEEKTVPVKEKKKMSAEKRTLFTIIGIFAVILVGGFSLIYFQHASHTILIDKSHISAPLVDLGPSAPGVLQWVSVHEGDQILPNTIVAQVGNEAIKSKDGGIVASVQDEVGKRLNPGEAVVTMIDPNELRVIGSIDENHGLQDVKVGQQATFTVDTFGSRTFYGVVDSISPTSEESGIVFNISDKRETKVFDVKVRYDIAQYPELKNGMSAKITILK